MAMPGRINLNGRSKYRAKKTVVGDITFDSRAEAERYGVLVMLEKAGEISDLKRQVAFILEVNGTKICTYRCDFTYRLKGRSVNGVAQQALIVEDVKGFRTRDYVLKRKLMKACYGIDILETGMRKRKKKCS